MAVPFDTPVSAIEGIGPSIENLLQPKGIYSVYDLLRVTSPALHGVVAGSASLRQVRSWRQMAALLEVATVTPQWAEALVKGDLTSTSELRRRDLSEVRTVFNDARDKKLIKDVPSDDQVAAMLADSALLDFAGAITGTVKDRSGQPVPGVTVVAGSKDVTTDDRGRFRILRLPLSSTIPLTMTKQSFQTASINVSPSPTSMVRVDSFTLLPQIVTQPRPSGQTAGNPSELRGDRLPPLQGQAVTSGKVPLSSLQPHDLLVVTEFKDDTDAKLVSKLLEFDGTRFAVHWVWAPKASLPDGLAIGDYLIKTGTGYRKVTMNPRKLARYKAFLQRYMGGRSPLPTDKFLAPIGSV